MRKRGLTGAVSGGTNDDLGNMFDIKGPALWTVSLIHDADKPADDIIKAIDEEIARLQTTPVTKDELDLALVKQRSRLYAEYESSSSASAAPTCSRRSRCSTTTRAKINRLEDEFRKVTPELIQKTAREYLRPTNRTILTITPKGRPRRAAQASLRPMLDGRPHQPALPPAPSALACSRPRVAAASRQRRPGTANRRRRSRRPRSRPTLRRSRAPFPSDAAEARRAARLQGARAEALHARQRPRGRAGAVGHHAEGARHA